MLTSTTIHGSALNLKDYQSQATLRLESSTASLATLACTTPAGDAAARTQHRISYHARLCRLCQHFRVEYLLIRGSCSTVADAAGGRLREGTPEVILTMP